MTVQRCSIITIVGPTNSGKSTLINSLVDAKVSIVTHKVQTTRYTIRGITNYQNAQLIFVDTPGIFSPNNTMEKFMVNTALGACANTEITMLTIDATKGITHNIKKLLKQINKPAIALLNKIDLIEKCNLLPLSNELSQLFDFDKIFMISALKKNGLDDVKEYLAQISPEEPWAYPEDQISDAPLEFVLSEITREKVMLRVHKEIPYKVIVETEQIESLEDKLIVHQVLYVTSNNHKKIIIGNHGSALRDIIRKSTSSMNNKLEKVVDLHLFIKVRKDWINNQRVLSHISY